MKIAFATIYNARDVRRGSGTYYHLCQELERQGHTVHYLGPLGLEFPVGTRLSRYISTRLLRGRYRSYQDPFMARKFGQEIERKLGTVDYDVLLTNDYGIAGYTSIERPLILWTDAIFPRHYDANINPRLDGLAFPSIYFCQRVTRRGLEAASQCIFPAQSTVEEVVQNYKINSGKVALIPFGSNLEWSPAENKEPRSFDSIMKKGRLDILFVGKDWQRKGGAVAAETVRLLHARGIKAVFHVVGCTPVVDLPAQSVHIYGALDKENQHEYTQLLHLYEQADVFLMPSKAEGFGIAYVEAASFGIPSLAYQTLGVETAVRHGRSGILLDQNKGAADFANVIASWYEHPATYEDLSAGALAYVQEEANWEHAIHTFMDLVQA